MKIMIILIMSLLRKNYEEECKKNVSDLLNEFPDNQVLSDHVKRIKEYIDNNPKKISIENMLNKEILVTNDKTKENKDIEKDQIISLIKTINRKFNFF